MPAASFERNMNAWASDERITVAGARNERHPSGDGATLGHARMRCFIEPSGGLR